MQWQAVISSVRTVLGPDGRGSAVVEYALLIALLAVACLLALDYLGGQTADGYSQAATSVSSS